MTRKVTRTGSLGCAIFCALVCLSCGSGPSSPPSGGINRKGPVNMLCYTSPDRPTVVMSAVFPITTVTPERMMEEPWAKDFRVYVGQVGGNEIGQSVTCDQVSSKDAAKEKADELRKEGHDVKQTNWTYLGG